MKLKPITGVHEAAQWLPREDVRFVDCRFELAHPDKGEKDYRHAHLPNAVYAHLERDLSDMTVQGKGRHPLPSESAFSQFLGRNGIGPMTLVVAYDGGDGANAARLWFLLKLTGHNNVTVLDGGLPIWNIANLPMDSTRVRPVPAFHPVKFNPRKLADSTEVLNKCGNDTMVLIDARGAPRFRGEVEPIDPVAGHVPGATNRFFMHNLETDGRFKSPGLLRGEWGKILDGKDPREVIVMCGSGVTACQNLLAMEYAGYLGGRLYAGSWSEWITDPARPVVRQ